MTRIAARNADTTSLIFVIVSRPYGRDRVKTPKRRRWRRKVRSRLIPGLALALYAIYLVLAFIVRSVVQRRRTGSTGFRGLSGKPGSPEWVGGFLFIVALVGGVAAPILDLTGVVEPVDAVDARALQWTGVALFVVGLGATLFAQEAMGRSWRIGVDHQERTELVTAGPFDIVRNPIFASMLPTSLGLVLLVPNVVALGSFGALIVALEIQTRLVEEPYLLRAHGERYGTYTSRVGRFLPGVGKLRAAHRDPSPRLA